MKTLETFFCLFLIGASAQNNQVQVAEEYGTLTQDQIGLASSAQAVNPVRGDVGNPDPYMMGQGNMLMTGMQNQMMLPQFDPMSGMMPQNTYMYPLPQPYPMPQQPYPMLPPQPGRCNNMNFRCPMGRSCYPRPPTP